MGVVKWKDNQCSYQDSIMIYKRPEVVSISPYMQHEVFQITETHPDLFIRLLKAPATSIAMFKITTCSGALTVGEHSHIFLPSINMEPRQKALHPHAGFASKYTSTLEHRICNKQIALDRPIKQPFPLAGPVQGQRTPNSLLPD